MPFRRPAWLTARTRKPRPFLRPAECCGALQPDYAPADLEYALQRFGCTLNVSRDQLERLYLATQQRALCRACPHSNRQRD